MRPAPFVLEPLQFHFLLCSAMTFMYIIAVQVSIYDLYILSFVVFAQVGAV